MGGMRLVGNNSGEATNPISNNFHEAIRHSQMIGKDGRPLDPTQSVPVLIVSYGDTLPIT